MMAAGRAAELGAKVGLVEKTAHLGNKLLLTGNGRCNITNQADLPDLVAAFGPEGKFLYRALTVFSNHDLIDFFRIRGLALRTEPDGKVFPSDDKAGSVLTVLLKYLEEQKVEILKNSAVKMINCRPGKNKIIEGVRLADGQVIEAGKVILSTGGLSYPKTGSTGDGYDLAKKVGHTIVPLRPGLTALESSDLSIRKLTGLALKDIVIKVVIDGKAKLAKSGDLLFTHFGVSGPEVLDLSGQVVDALAAGRTVELSLNLRPDSSPEEFENLLQKEFDAAGAKTLAGYLNKVLPTSLAEFIERRADLPADKKLGLIGRQERRMIAACFTDLRIPISKPRPSTEAMVTRGGVALGEIDPNTMESKLVSGLYFCGEMIDCAGISGGYNLQAAFSTGYLAGESAGGGGLT